MPSSWPWLVLLKIRNCSWNAEFFLLHTYLQFIELTSDWIQISINRYLVVWKWTHCLLIVYCRTQTQSKLLVKHLYNSGIKYVRVSTWKNLEGNLCLPTSTKGRHICLHIFPDHKALAPRYAMKNILNLKCYCGKRYENCNF